LRAVVLEDPGVAVGEGGTILVQRDYGDWQDQGAGTTETLVGVSADPFHESRSRAVFGEQGFWQTSFYEAGAGSVVSCRQDPPFGAMGWISADEWLVVDTTGVVYAVECDADRRLCEWCQHSTLGTREFLGQSSRACGTRGNSLVLTSEAVFLLLGPLNCIAED
jgi:hypothetical protein